MKSQRQAGHAGAETRQHGVRLQRAPHADRVGQTKAVNACCPRGPAQRTRKLGAARDASWAPTETKAKCRRAASASRPNWSKTQDLGLFMMRSWMADTGREKWTASTSVRRARSRSPAVARHHTASRLGRPSRAMARIVSISSSPMAGVPTSSSAMPASARAAAIASLSPREKASPGACSPSRNVVSTSQVRDLWNLRSILLNLRWLMRECCLVGNSGGSAEAVLEFRRNNSNGNRGSGVVALTQRRQGAEAQRHEREEGNGRTAHLPSTHQSALLPFLFLCDLASWRL